VTGLGVDLELKEARNTYYSAIRKAKRECWEAFLTGQPKELQAELDDGLKPDDTAWCWKALRYCYPQAARAIAVLKRP
jgi:hypothetical protein